MQQVFGENTKKDYYARDFVQEKGLMVNHEKENA